MKKIPLLFLSAITAVALITTTATLSYAKPEYTKKEKKACTTCHSKPKDKELNDVGKCYGEKKDLKACMK